MNFENDVNLRLDGGAQLIIDCESPRSLMLYALLNTIDSNHRQQKHREPICGRRFAYHHHHYRTGFSGLLDPQLGRFPITIQAIPPLHQCQGSRMHT